MDPLSVLWAIIVWALFGLIIGAIARLLVPGPQPIGLLGTMLIGIVGSFAGGLLYWLIAGGEPLQPTGWILSILGAVIVLALATWGSRRRSNVT